MGEQAAQVCDAKAKTCLMAVRATGNETFAAEQRMAETCAIAIRALLGCDSFGSERCPQCRHEDVSLAEVRRLRKALDRHRRWLLAHGPFVTDHACSDCIDSDSNVVGFRCVYHEAVRSGNEASNGGRDDANSPGKAGAPALHQES